MQTYILKSELMSYSEQELLAYYHSLTQELAITDTDTPEYQETLNAMHEIKRAIFAKRSFGPK